MSGFTKKMSYQNCIKIALKIANFSAAFSILIVQRNIEAWFVFS